MKGITTKILILALIVAFSFCAVACDFSDVWGYFIGDFPTADLGGDNPMTSGTTPGENPSGSSPIDPPSVDSSDLVINQGNASTQTGGLADVVEGLIPSVVEITTVYNYVNMWDGKKYTLDIGGSGVFIKKDSDGVYVLTNQHVVEKGANEGQYRYTGMEIIVKASDGMEYAANKIFEDYTHDVALIYITIEELGDRYDGITVASTQSEYSIEEGERVVVIGNPLGTLGGTVTSGIISATEREIYVDEERKMMLIQSDAAVNEGNSGGGMFNSSGKLIGIVIGKISATGVEGLGFAVSIKDALGALHQNGYLLDLTC